MLKSHLERIQSKEIYENMCSYIPGGVNSPARAFLSVGVNPLVVSQGKGDTICDADGNHYIDYCCSWGALILGHADPQVVEDSISQIKEGSTFGITTELEGRIAKKIIELIPSVEKIRFVSTGTEATMSAIRLARGFTERDIIIKFTGNYHGHCDSLLTSAGIPRAVIENTISLPYNDCESVRACFTDPKFKNKIACIIVEPIAGNMGVVPASHDFLKCLRDVTFEEGALLIFDEVITGFRVGLQGAQGLYKIRPDLTCLGKIIGGGFPAAAYGGSREIMDYLTPLGPVFQAGTLSGNPVAMQAGLTTISQLELPGIYEELEAKSALLLDSLKVCVKRVGSMFTIFFENDKRFAHFFNYLLQRGIYIPQSQYEACFISLAHTKENLIYTRDVILEYIENELSKSL